MYHCYNIEKDLVVQNRPKQTENLLAKIKRHIDSGNFRLSKHANKRQSEREISLPKVLYVLTHGYHEERMSLFDNVFQTWKYAIRGKTLDGVDVRVIVAFVDEMIIITVIRVTK